MIFVTALFTRALRMAVKTTAGALTVMKTMIFPEISNMKRAKRLISVILTALTLCTCMCTAQAAGSYFLKDGFYFGVKNGEAYIHGTDGTGWDIVIPEMFLKYYVTEIEDHAFYENNSIEVLSFYEAYELRRIGDSAFAHCPKLKNVHITESIQEMGVSAFEDCASLSSLRFRDGALTDIPAQCFYGCRSLQNVIFDNELTSIGNFAFAECSSLKRLEIPKSVTYISKTAFRNDTELTLAVWYGSCAHSYALENEIAYALLDGVKLGDTDGDGSVNINDVTTIQRHLAELETLEGIYLHAADANQDGTVDIADATIIQMYLAEYEMEYPIGEVMTQ